MSRRIEADAGEHLSSCAARNSPTASSTARGPRIGPIISFRSRISLAHSSRSPDGGSSAPAGTVIDLRDPHGPPHRAGRLVVRAPFDRPSLARAGFVWVRPGPRLLDGRISELTESHGVYGVLEKVAGPPSSGALGLPRSANLRTTRQRDAARQLRTRVGQNLSNTRQWAPTGTPAFLLKGESVAAPARCSSA
jgi:hypothetical protein